MTGKKCWGEVRGGGGGGGGGKGGGGGGGGGLEGERQGGVGGDLSAAPF